MLTMKNGYADVDVITHDKYSAKIDRGAEAPLFVYSTATL